MLRQIFKKSKLTKKLKQVLRGFWLLLLLSIKGNLEGKKLPKQHTEGLVKALNIKLRLKGIKQIKLSHHNFKLLGWM